MSTQYSHDSKPCCTIPPVVSDYKPKGHMTTRMDMDSYEVNPESKQVIISVFDIYGLHPSSQQGADALAGLGFHVIMPNWFKAPPITHEEVEKGGVMDFIQSKGPPPVKAKEVLELAKQLKTEGKTSVGVYGLCWGGKVITLAGAQEASVLSGVASIHPAMVAPDDFKDLKQPIAFFPSGDEPADAVAQSWEIIKGTPSGNKSVFHRYADMHHGWAGARAKLSEAENVKQFEDVYRRLGDFFKSVA